MNRIDPPVGYGLNGQPLPSVLNHITLTDSKQPSQSQSQPQSTTLLKDHLLPGQKKRGRKKKELVDNEAQAEIAATKLARKRTAYSIFAHQERNFFADLKFENMQKGLGKYLSRRWKVMDANERQLYEAIAMESGSPKTCPSNLMVNGQQSDSQVENRLNDWNENTFC